MTAIKPIKTLPIAGITLTPIGFWPNDEGAYYGEDQFWEGGPAPQPVRFKLEGSITQQNHGSFSTPRPYIYNAFDINVGDWYVEISTGKALQITAIDWGVSNTEFISCTIEDIDRWEQFSDQNGVAATGAPGFIVSLDDNGIPVFTDLIVYQAEIYPNVGFVEDVVGRFRQRNLLSNSVRVYQPGHGFTPGDVIVLQNTGEFVLANANTADAERTIGTVTAIGIPGVNWFNYEPKGKLEQNLPMLLPGDPGDIVWVDPDVPGKLTNVKPASLAIPVYIKIGDYIGVKLYQGPIGPVNKFNSTTDPTPNDDALSGYSVGSQWINLITGIAWILVDATPGAAMWSETSSITGPTGPVGPPQTGAYQRYTYIATEGQVRFTASHVPGYVDVYYNNLKLLPSQYNDSNASYVDLSEPSVAGDPVEIVAWQIADISQLTGPTGPTGNLGPTGPAATGAYVRHEFVATAGQTVFLAAYYVGFVDVYYNGTLLSQDQYIASDGSTVILLNPSLAGDPVVIVAWELTNISQNTGPTGPTGAFSGLVFNTIAERDAFLPALGQVAYVFDDGTGYNSAYIVAQVTPSVVWIPISIAPQSINPAQGEKRYVDTVSKQFSYLDSGATLLANIAANTTVMSVDVVVTVPFTDIAASLTVGTDGNQTVFMSATMNDLAESATFINDQKYTVLTNTEAKVFINPGTSSAGEAQVTITYR